MARNSNKDIDFLSVYKTKKKININSKTLLLIALPVLLILIFATSTLYLQSLIETCKRMLIHCKHK